MEQLTQIPPAESTKQPHSEVQACYHCGEACREQVILADEHTFCCEGCVNVYDILKETDLCDYYRIEGASGISPDQSYFNGKFDYLDLPEVSSKILEFTDGKLATVNWYIPKMHCSSCIWLLEQLYKFNPAIRSSVVNFPEKKVRITFNCQAVSMSELAGLITRIGYEPYISLNDLEAGQAKKWNRTRLYKIGVAGFCFGNIMMLSFPEYFHLGTNLSDQNLRITFGALNFALSIPVLLYCANDFFKSAWAALRGKYLNIDAPIVLALLSIFFLSVYQLGTGTGPGYFDSLTGAVFFMLIGRYFQDKTYAGISFDRNYKSYFPVAVSVIRSGTQVQKPITDLAPGDIVFVRNAELIPADSVLLSPEALIDYSFVSGEAEPVIRKKGDTIYAGGKQTGASIEVEVLRKVSQSYLTQLWNNQAFAKEKEDQNKMLSARINRYFSVIVFIIALATFLTWYLVLNDTETGFRAFTTCLLVACPCGLLFSSTFTNGNILAQFGKYHCYPKNADAVERLSHIDTVVFDKTGTITRSTGAEVRFEGKQLSTEELVMIKSVAMQSSHPLCRLIVENLQTVQASRRNLTNYEEVKGAGIAAFWGDREIRLGSVAWTGAIFDPGQDDANQDTSRVFVKIGGELLGYYTMQIRFRENLRETIAELQHNGFETCLLSGDKPTELTYLASVFGSADRLHFNHKPEDKLRFIEALQKDRKNVLMVGDGLNDAGALQQSDVGVAVSDDVNNFSPSCDMIIEGNQLAKIPAFIKLARSGQNIIKASFCISLVYNILGLFFAIGGQLSPVLAAILMPVSLITIVSFTTLASSISARRIMKS